MAVDIPDYTQAVNVTGGSVSITGTATVQITGTPTVSISGTPTVNVGNTPAVTINSGTVTATISGTPSINIQSQSVTVAVNQPATSLGTLSAGLNVVGANATFNLPTGTHAVVLMLAGANTPNPPAAGFANPTSIQVLGVQSGNVYLFDTSGVPPPYFAFAVDSAVDTQIKITMNGPTAGGASILAEVFVGAALDTLAAFVQNTFDTPISTVQIGSQRAQGGNSSPNTLPPWPYDARGVSAPGTGSQASVVLAATPGKTYTASMIAASLAQISGAATAPTADLLDGASTIWSRAQGVTGTVGDKDHFELSGLGLRGTSGNSMTFQVSVGVAGVAERANIGAYLG